MCINEVHSYNFFGLRIRVSELPYFGAAPAPTPGKREHNFGIFKTDYE